jgi:Skp family chaperone for outer membrane proteins
MRYTIRGEIKTAVNAKAKLENFALVMDSAAETVNGTLAVVYNNGQNDITETILSQLNAGTPIDVTKPAPSAP